MTRLRWSELPPRVVAVVEGVLGSPVVVAESQPAGFSPGSADRVVTASGRRAFVKAVSHARNADTHGLIVRESRVLALLPASVAAPRELGSWSDAEWAVLVLDDVEGRHPDRPGDVGAVLDALLTLPRLSAGSGLASLVPGLATQFEGWSRIRAAGALDTVPDWARARVDELERLAALGAAASEGDRVVHGDFRADNALVDETGAVRIIDWPWAGFGCRWFDGLSFLLDVELRSPGSDVGAELSHPLFAEASADRIDAVLAGLAGLFLDSARGSSPESMPTLRGFQRAEGEAALRWLARRWGEAG